MIHHRYEEIRPRMRPLPRFQTWLIPALCLLAGCGGEPAPVLRVERVGFSAVELSELSPAQVEEVGDLAALGWSVSRGEVEDLVSPLVTREVERSRLAALPYHLGALRLGLSEQALRDAYASAPEWELTVRHLVRLAPRWAPADERERARRVASDAAARARAGEDLATLAIELSEEPGARETAGLLRPGRAGSWVEPFWAAALALREGETSDVVETEYGYHVLRVEARRPLPFADAARLPLLRRLVPAPVAMAAMEEWAATRPPVGLLEEEVARAREELLRGCLPDSVALTGGRTGGYTARDLGLAWVALTSDERARLRDAASFTAWATDDARERIWARAAEAEGVPPSRTAEASGEWASRLHRAGAALGFEEGQDPAAIRRLSLAALASRGQEARIARTELAAFRPLLRRRYRFEGPVVSCAAESTSEMRKSENTR